MRHIFEDLKRVVEQSPLPRGVETPCMSWPDGWFGDLEGSSSVAPISMVKRMCGGCPVRIECLSWAMEAEQSSYRYGVWGGYTPSERARLAGEWSPVATESA